MFHATLYVPSGCKALYEAADYWKDFYEIVEMDIETPEPSDANRLFAHDAEGCSGSQMVLQVEMVNDREVAGFTCDLRLPEGVTVAVDEYDELIAELVSSRAKRFTLRGARLSNGVYRFATLPNSTAKIQGTEGVVLNLTLNISDDMADGDYTVRLTNCNLTVSEDGSLATLPVADSQSKLSVTSIVLGDVNNDGKVDLTDAIAITYDYLQQTTVGFVRKAADVNGDKRVDLTDAIAVVYMYFQGATAREAKKPNDENMREPQ